MPLLQHAIDYAIAGWPVIPLRGKIPITKNGSKDWTIMPREVAAKQWPGIGLVTGVLFWVMDIDGPDGRETLARLLRHNELPRSPIAKTRNGAHYYFLVRPDGPKMRNATKALPGIDVRGVGGYVVAPPSPHPEGGRYEWIVSPQDADLDWAPKWLVHELGKKKRDEDRKRKHSPARVDGGEFEIEKIPHVTTGSRNASLYRYACAAAKRGRTPEQIQAEISWINENRCDQPLHDREVDVITRSASRYCT